MGAHSTPGTPVDGMELVDVPADPALRAWRAAAAQAEAVASLMGAARLRLTAKQRARDTPQGPDMAVVEEHDLGAHLTVRLYRPRLAALPLVVYAHGGGFVTGDLETHDRLARRLAQHADMAVLAVDYRRAPENRAPAGIDDIVRAAEWAGSMAGMLGGAAGADVGLAGDSAGGLLAAAATLRLRGAGGMMPRVHISHVLLMTPMLDLTLTQPSVTTYGHGEGIELQDIAWYVDQWVPELGRRPDPDLSPAFGMLAGMPPTAVMTAERDPLRDDGLWFADRLRAAGVPTLHLHHEGLPHGFFQYDTFSTACEQAGDQALRRYGEFVRAVLPEPTEPEPRDRPDPRTEPEPDGHPGPIAYPDGAEQGSPGVGLDLLDPLDPLDPLAGPWADGGDDPVAARE